VQGKKNEFLKHFFMQISPLSLPFFQIIFFSFIINFFPCHPPPIPLPTIVFCIIYTSLVILKQHVLPFSGKNKNYLRQRNEIVYNIIA